MDEKTECTQKGQQPPPYETYSQHTNVPQQQTAGYQQTQGYQQPQYLPNQQPYQGNQYPQAPGNVTMVVSPYPPQTVGWVNDNLAISIVSLFFCCILGIFAVIKSSEAKDAQQRGDYNTAVVAARKAKNLAVAAIIIGIIVGVIAFVIGIVARLVIYTSYDNDNDSY
ncbi:hypothetical protein RRG08_015361 [Elysia crispata]|uniref:Interferon-induced transmembrane protein n=1 Tax=Elysia crispata TaxID=231223 RepID=A0AAE1A9B7_9GAST|nr:hypothetical protein RRG08_015361 [Elysia crispata]